MLRDATRRTYESFNTGRSLTIVIRENRGYGKLDYKRDVA